MVEARKENRVYTIDESLKDRYLKEGFDIYNEKGEIVEYTPLKKIKYSEHIKEVNELKTKISLLESEKNKTADNVVDLLKGYANEKEVDVGSSTSAKGILDKILEAEKEV
jgi:hypothetical protein